MKKAPEAFRTISEVSDILDTPAHVLRFWESKFYQVRPVKRAGGRRYYRPDDLALIAGIKHLLQDRGMTIRGVQKIMQEEGVRHVIALGRNSGLLASEDETVLEIAVTAPADTPAPGTAPPAPAAVTHLASPQLANPQVGSAPTMETPVEIPAAVASPEPPASAPPQPVAGSASPRAGSEPPDLPPPDLSPDALPDSPRYAALLRAIPAEAALPAHVGALAQRLDHLLDRMADASGTRRW